MGSKSTDLAAVNEPFNDENKCCSWTNGSGFKIPKVHGVN